MPLPHTRQGHNHKGDNTMLQSCGYCGKLHKLGYECPKKPHPHTTQTATDKLRNTYRWQRKRDQIKADAHHMCEVCAAQGKLTTQHLEIHHITKLRDNPNLLTDDTNLICLCRYHHRQADAGQIESHYLKQLAAKRQKR